MFLFSYLHSLINLVMNVANLFDLSGPQILSLLRCYLLFLIHVVFGFSTRIPSLAMAITTSLVLFFKCLFFDLTNWTDPTALLIISNFLVAWLEAVLLALRRSESEGKKPSGDSPVVSTLAANRMRSESGITQKSMDGGAQQIPRAAGGDEEEEEEEFDDARSQFSSWSIDETLPVEMLSVETRHSLTSGNNFNANDNQPPSSFSFSTSPPSQPSLSSNPPLTLLALPAEQEQVAWAEIMASAKEEFLAFLSSSSSPSSTAVAMAVVGNPKSSSSSSSAASLNGHLPPLNPNAKAAANAFSHSEKEKEKEKEKEEVVMQLQLVHEQKDCHIWRSVHASLGLTLKVSAHLGGRTPPAAVLQALIFERALLQWNSLLRSVRIVHSFDNQPCDIIHCRFKAMWPAAPRDAVLLRWWDLDRSTGDGMMVMRSIALDSLPPEAGVIRANILLQGYLIRVTPPTNTNAHANEVDGCQLEWALKLDPCGWVPNRVYKQLVSEELPAVVARLQEFQFPSV